MLVYVKQMCKKEIYLRNLNSANTWDKGCKRNLLICLLVQNIYFAHHTHTYTYTYTLLYIYIYVCVCVCVCVCS